ncbi:polysaccharide deacetylase family protein [Lutibacter sp.]
MERGNFIVSLDFELHWGSVEKENVELVKNKYDFTRKGIPIILDLFDKFNIHATWATVGFLFAKNKKQLIEFSPKIKPTYEDNSLSYYSLIDNNKIGRDENEDPYHYAPSIISKIIETPNQEIATHTFSHFYCNESGQNLKQFEADLKAAQSLSKQNFNIELKSLVFPRNQFNSEYIEVAKQNGIKVIRSNPNVWFWNINFKLNFLVRAIDTLLPISNPLSFSKKKIAKGEVLLLPASRFLRPYSSGEKNIQVLKFTRIKNEMTFAAKNNLVYHLWWHPHNFGNSLEENLRYLRNILEHFDKLNKKYGFSSKSMLEMYSETS